MVIPNDTPNPFTFEFSKVAPVRKPGGTVKIVDNRTFKVSQKISAAEVELDVGGLRYLFSFALGHDRFLIWRCSSSESYMSAILSFSAWSWLISFLGFLVASYSTGVDVLYVRSHMLTDDIPDVFPIDLVKPGLPSSLLKAMLPLTTFTCVRTLDKCL